MADSICIRRPGWLILITFFLVFHLNWSEESVEKQQASFNSANPIGRSKTGRLFRYAELVFDRFIRMNYWPARRMPIIQSHRTFNMLYFISIWSVCQMKDTQISAAKSLYFKFLVVDMESVFSK